MPARPGVIRRRRQGHGVDLQFVPGEDRRHSGSEGMIFIGTFFVAAREQKSRRGGVGVEDAGQSVFGRIGLTGNAIGANVVRFEKCTEPVIVLLRNRIVHMVMASGAIERRSQERLGRVLDRKIEPHVAIELVPVPHQKTGGPHRRRIVRRQFVAGQHFDDHLVVGLVGIEPFDDPVAPAPDVRLTLANLRSKSIPVAVPPDVHPVPSPALAIMRAVEQAVDHFVIRVGRIVNQESLHLAARRRQADQIEVHAPQQRGLCRRGAGLQRVPIVFGGNECVDRIADPCRISRHGKQWADGGLVRPMPGRILGDLFHRSLGALVNPGTDRCNLFGSQRLAFGGHLCNPVCAGYGVNQQAFAALAGNDRRAPASPFDRQLGRVETQVVFLLERAVTGVAAPRKNRLHVLHVVDSRRAVRQPRRVARQPGAPTAMRADSDRTSIAFYLHH